MRFRKVESLGASKSVVSLVIPTGYSFNMGASGVTGGFVFRFCRRRSSSRSTTVRASVGPLTNLIDNGVATIVISRWEGELDTRALHQTMSNPIRLGEEMERLAA